MINKRMMYGKEVKKKYSRTRKHNNSLLGDYVKIKNKNDWIDGLRCAVIKLYNKLNEVEKLEENVFLNSMRILNYFRDNNIERNRSRLALSSVIIYLSGYKDINSILRESWCSKITFQYILDELNIKEIKKILE